MEKCPEHARSRGEGLVRSDDKDLTVAVEHLVNSSTICDTDRGGVDWWMTATPSLPPLPVLQHARSTAGGPPLPAGAAGVLTQGQVEDLEVAAVPGGVHRDVGVAVVPEDQRAGAPLRLDRIPQLGALFNAPQDYRGQTGALGDTLDTSETDWG